MTAAFYTIDEAAAILNIEKSSVYRLVNRGEIHATRKFGRWLIPITTFHAELKKLGVDTKSIEKQKLHLKTSNPVERPSVELYQ